MEPSSRRTCEQLKRDNAADGSADGPCRRLRRLALQEEQEQHALDAILAKVSAFGIQSLTWRERRALKQATSRQWAGEDDEADLEPRHNI